MVLQPYRLWLFVLSIGFFLVWLGFVAQAYPLRDPTSLIPLFGALSMIPAFAAWGLYLITVWFGTKPSDRGIIARLVDPELGASGKSIAAPFLILYFCCLSFAFVGALASHFG